MKKTFLTILSICTLITTAAIADEIDAKEKNHRAAIEKVPSCANILGTCKAIGFVAGEHQSGNGLWRDCFYPTVAGKKINSKGRDVIVNGADVTTCKSEAKMHLKDALKAQEKTLSNQ